MRARYPGYRRGYHHTARYIPVGFIWKYKIVLRCLDHSVVRKRGIESTGVQRVSLLTKNDRH